MEISPRPFGEVLGEGMTMLGRVWRRILPPAFWAFLVMGGLTIAAFAATGSGDFLQLVLSDPGAMDSMTDDELRAAAVELLQIGFFAVVLQLIASGFVNLTVHRIVGSELAGEPVSPGQASSRAGGRLAALIVAGLFILIAVVLGLLALIIPGIWLAGSFTMVPPVIALEDKGPLSALRRSYELVRGRWWPTVGFLLLVGLIGSVAAQLVQLFALPVLSTGEIGLGAGLGYVLLVVVQGFVVAAIAVMTTMWYVDLRARKEPLVTASLT